MVTVKTKEELKKAIDKKEEEIFLEGEIAEQYTKLKPLFKLSMPKLIAIEGLILLVIGAGAATAPLTAGGSFVLSVAAATPIATLSGIEVALIILAASVGISLIITSTKEYDFDFDVEMSDKIPRVKFKRKHSKSVK